MNLIVYVAVLNRLPWGLLGASRFGLNATLGSKATTVLLLTLSSDSVSLYKRFEGCYKSKERSSSLPANHIAACGQCHHLPPATAPFARRLEVKSRVLSRQNYLRPISGPLFVTSNAFATRVRRLGVSSSVGGAS